MYQIEILRLILEALQEMRETHHLAEVPFDVRSDVLLQRALEALVVRLPDGEELRRAACAHDLDKHAVPGLPLPGRLVGKPPRPAPLAPASTGSRPSDPINHSACGDD